MQISAKSFLFLLLGAIPLAAQDPSATTPAAGQHEITLIIDCKTTPDSLEACKSFNELATARDSDVMALLMDEDVYVCLRPNEDTFTIISLSTPPDTAFSKLPTAGYAATGLIRYAQFKKGQSDESFPIFGKWTKPVRSDTPTFLSNQKVNVTALASDAEISVDYHYTNVSGGRTHYILQIRRSTLRAKESLFWNNPSKNPKAPAPDTGSYDIEGRCVAF